MMKYIAFGMVIALILDATIIRMLLVPSVMHLLGPDNWWAPRWVKRLSEKVGHNEQLESGSHETMRPRSSSRVTVAELSGVDAIAPVPAQRPGEAPARQRDLPFAELMRRMESSRNATDETTDEKTDKAHHEGDY